MPIRLNKEAYQQLINEDLEWLLEQPRTLERDHIESCMKWLLVNRPEEKPRRSPNKVADLKLPEDYIAFGLRYPKEGEDEEDEKNHEHFVCSDCGAMIFLHLQEQLDEYLCQKENKLCQDCSVE